MHGNAFEANTTRERGQRAASPSAYSRARARSAGSDTTSSGVWNSVASASARQPAMLSIPSGSSALPGGNRVSRASTPPTVMAPTIFLGGHTRAHGR